MSSPRSLTSRVAVHGLSLRKEIFCKKHDGRRKLLEDWYGCHLVVCAQDRVGGPYSFSFSTPTPKRASSQDTYAVLFFTHAQQCRNLGGVGEVSDNVASHQSGRRGRFTGMEK